MVMAFVDKMIEEPPFTIVRQADCLLNYSLGLYFL